MVLTEEQAKLFYKLWIPLLDYVNRKYRIEKELYGMISLKGIPLQRVMKIIDKLWVNVSVIDEYLDAHSKQMSEEEINIVAGWKNAISGTFLVERHLKKGTVLISSGEDGTVYLVSGIYSEWWEMLKGFSIPQIVKATLMPFQGKIIPDGIVRPYGVTLSKGMAEQAKRMYMNAKSTDCIKTCLGDIVCEIYSKNT